MDQYIIDNMPDDEPSVVSHIKFTMADVDGTRFSVDLAEVDQTGGIEMVFSITAPGDELLDDGRGGVVIAAFDPTLTLTQVLSVIKVITSGEIAYASDEMNEVAARLLDNNTEDNNDV
ncbi:MAG: hypothetical protein ACK53T_00190 [Planctomycetota bacterium]|jgi:hypothetical protein